MTHGLEHLSLNQEGHGSNSLVLSKFVQFRSHLVASVHPAMLYKRKPVSGSYNVNE